MNIAIISPSRNSYSETFIAAHKNLLEGNIHFYFDGAPPTRLEGKGLLKSSKIIEFVYRLRIKLNKINPEQLKNKRFGESLKREKIDLVLAEYGTTAPSILNECKERNIPLIVHFHGYDASMHHIIKEFKEEYLKVFEYASYIIVVSKVMEQKILDIGAPKEKVILNTYGPNELFSFIQPNYSEQKFVGIGRFVNKKAQYYTILAFTEVVKQYPKAKLILAGDGYLLNTCKNLCKAFEIQNNVTFKGVITQEEYRDELKTALAFVQHSITAEDGDMEGTPLAVLEASYAGLPVISTIHAGIPDVISHNKTGLLCDEHDYQQMAKNMCLLIENNSLARKLGINGHKNIVDNFSMDKHIETLNMLITKAANNA